MNLMTGGAADEPSARFRILSRPLNQPNQDLPA